MFIQRASKFLPSEDPVVYWGSLQRYPSPLAGGEGLAAPAPNPHRGLLGFELRPFATGQIAK